MDYDEELSNYGVGTFTRFSSYNHQRRLLPHDLRDLIIGHADQTESEEIGKWRFMEEYSTAVPEDPRQLVINDYRLSIAPKHAFTDRKFISEALSHETIQDFVREVSYGDINWGPATWDVATAALGPSLE